MKYDRCVHETFDCLHCSEQITGAAYQRAWLILRRKISGNFRPTALRRLKKMMNEALREAQDKSCSIDLTKDDL